jgi:hypothetical protein
VSDYWSAYYVPTGERGVDNPHFCIIDGNAACLACGLIEAMGEDRRSEALDIASRLAERAGA